MSLLSWAEERTKAMTLWDVGFLKISAMLFGMVLGAFLASFVIENLWWFVVPLVLLGGRSGYRWFTAKETSTGGG